MYDLAKISLSHNRAHANERLHTRRNKQIYSWSGIYEAGKSFCCFAFRFAFFAAFFAFDASDRDCGLLERETSAELSLGVDFANFLGPSALGLASSP